MYIPEVPNCGGRQGNFEIGYPTFQEFPFLVLWLEKLLKFTSKNALKLFTMVRENCEIYLSQMTKNALWSTMVGDNFEIYLSEMAKSAL